MSKKSKFKQPIKAKKADFKNRVYAIILLCFMVFWTFGSVFGIVACLDKKQRSSMSVVSAIAEEVGRTGEVHFNLPELNGMQMNLFYPSSSSSVSSYGLVTQFVSSFSFVYSYDDLEFYVTYNDTEYTWYDGGPAVMPFKHIQLTSPFNNFPTLSTYEFSFTITCNWMGDIFGYPLDNTCSLVSANFGTRSDIEMHNGYLFSLFFRFMHPSTSMLLTYEVDFHLAQLVNADFEFRSFFFPSTNRLLEDFNTSYPLFFQWVDPENNASDYDLGYNQGYIDGISVGNSVGYEEGYTEGYQGGFTEGQQAVTNQAYSNGYNKGYAIGFGAGKEEGISESAHHAYTFEGLLSAVIDAPLNAFIGLFNFELLGVNLANFFFSLLTVCLVLALVKLFI